MGALVSWLWIHRDEIILVFSVWHWNSHQDSWRSSVLPWLKNVGNRKSKESLPRLLWEKVFLRTPWGWTEFKEDDFFFLVVLQELEPFKILWHHLWLWELWIKQEALSRELDSEDILKWCQSQNLMSVTNSSQTKTSDFHMRNLVLSHSCEY